MIKDGGMTRSPARRLVVVLLTGALLLAGCTAGSPDPTASSAGAVERTSAILMGSTGPVGVETAELEHRAEL